MKQQQRTSNNRVASRAARASPAPDSFFGVSMSISITSWLRAFFALQERAMDSRGFFEVQIAEDEFIRWPRTTGSDVISIAAVVDPSIREQPLRFGGHGLA